MVGPTAAGKSEVALAIARRCRGEVISADSMQVYRGMDIGTAKVAAEVRAEIPHHLIDVCDPDHDMAVAEFQQLGRAALRDIDSRNSRAIICGGSGLHFRALVDPLDFPARDPGVRAEIEAITDAEAQRRLLELDPEAGAVVDLANPRRVNRALEIALVTGLVPSQRAVSAEAEAIRRYQPAIEFVAIGLDPGSELGDRVERRFDGMLGSGLLEEVRTLRGCLGRLAAQAVGYRQLIPVVDGQKALDSARLEAIKATKSLAKRQRTFFRRDPRIVWIPWQPEPEARVQVAVEELSRRLPWIL